MVAITPEEAIALRGLRKGWVSKQMGISPSYLSLLLSGSRRWTESLKRRFSCAIGIQVDAICFATDCTETVQDRNEQRAEADSQLKARRENATE